MHELLIFALILIGMLLAFVLAALWITNRH